MKFAARSVVVLSTLLVATAALAQTAAPAPDYTLASNVALVTDYRFRGISQTGFKPALQAGVDFAHSSGLYLGAFGSNVSWIKDFNGATRGNLEIDLYGGFKGSIVPDVGYDIGFIRYQYPRNNSGAAGTPGFGLYSNANTTEVYGALSYSVASLKYSRSIGNFLGNLNSNGSQYLELNANFDLGNGFTLTPHIGRQKIPNQGPTGDIANYTDYSLGVAKDLGNGLVVSAAAIGTDASKVFYTDLNGRFLGKSTVVAGLKYNF